MLLNINHFVKSVILQNFSSIISEKRNMKSEKVKSPQKTTKQKQLRFQKSFFFWICLVFDPPGPNHLPGRWLYLHTWC